MAMLMTAVSSIAPALQAAGTIIGTLGAIRSGQAQKSAASYEAAQLDAAAKTERAVAQRAALDERRQTDIMLSRARAVAGASGGGQDIPLMGAIEEEGEMRALTALWEGEEAAKGRRAQATAARFEGRQAATAGMLGGASILTSGTNTFLEAYG